MPWIVAHAVVAINPYLIRQDGETSYERVFNKAHSGPLVHFGERVLAHHQATPPQNLHLRSQPQKRHSLWLRKRVITGMHIVAHEGQVLKARTATRLVKDQQFNPVKFNKITLPPHESEPHYQEPREDRIALQELLRSFIMQQQSKFRSKTSSPQISVLKSLLSMPAHQITASIQPRERIKDHHHCQHHQQKLHHHNQ